MKRDDLPKSSLVYILGALIPYTDPNLKLVFRPGQFFKDLALISDKKEQTLRNQFYKMKLNKYFTVTEGVLSFSELGNEQLERFYPKQLGPESCLMVIFDIPENLRGKRRSLRLLLRELKFKQVQKSVWCSQYESRSYLIREIRSLELEDYVQIYEAAKII